MRRRDVLKFGAAGLATAGIGYPPLAAFAQSLPSPVDIRLGIRDVSTRLIDGTSVNMLGFSLEGGAGSLATGRVPGPVLRVKEGSDVRITIRNDRREVHGFEITGIPDSKTEIAAGGTSTITFKAPAAGTYLYHDAYGGTPLYRLLGLHGVMVVEPLYGNTYAGSRTPYSIDKLTVAQRDAVSALFDALGMTARFPGGAAGKWVPAPSTAEASIQEKIWMCSSVDPKFNALITPGKPIAYNPTLTSDVVGNFVPRYFTINNRSGFDLHADSDGTLPVVARNYIGEPTLYRVVNVGLAHHANHFHGNHLMELARVDLNPRSPTYGQLMVPDSIAEVDTTAMWPMQRRDLLLPFEVPPDIPYSIPVTSPTGGQFQRMVNGQAQEPFPLRYVMHCHVEMSQTAGGGNYPQGMVSHWEILGGVGGRAKAAAKLATR